MERVILLPGRARTSRLLSRTLLRRRTATAAAPSPGGRANVKDAVTVILGGGRGHRLFPLTQRRAKPAVPVGGKYSLVDVAISNSLNSEIDRVFILTQFNSASLNSHVANTYRFDNFAKGFVEILAAEQTEQSSDWYQGTADAVRKQMHRIRATGAKEVVILSGDHLYEMDLRDFVARHREARADVTVAVTPVPRRDASSFGLLRVDEDEMIVEFAEKPKDPAVLDRFAVKGPDEEQCLASMGIYVFRMDVLEALLADESANDFGMHVIPRAIQRHPVAAHAFKGYWEDLGTIASYHRANLELTQRDSPFDFFSARNPIFTRPSCLPAAKIQRSRLDAVLVSEGCAIEESELSQVVLGIRSRVGKGSVVQRTIVLGSTSFPDGAGPTPGIGERCRIRNAIIDRDARIGNDVVLENRREVKHHDGPNLHVRDGIIIVPEGAVIPDGFVF